MTTIKSFTDLEQSKKLAEILPIESADMVYLSYANLKTNTVEYDYPSVNIDGIEELDVPCWSLAALLSILPKSVRLVGTPKESYWYCECVDSNSQWYGGFESADNPFDACYKMIIKLNKQNLLVK